MKELILQPWPWWVAGPGIALVLFLMLFFGKNFGISASFRTICSASGAGRFADFFRYNWKSDYWNLLFILGAIIGGSIAHLYLMPERTIHISESTKVELREYGLSNPGEGFIPTEIINWENLFSIQGILFIILGGFLLGFGARYAGGCTSGQAISGLAELQWPSLLAVIGFFIGGLFITYFILPYTLGL